MARSSSPPHRQNGPVPAPATAQADDAVLSRMLSQGDPLADAVIAELRSDRAGRAVIEAGLQSGLRSVTDAPPDIAALFRQLEEMPPWIDAGLLEASLVAHFAVEPLWAHTIVLGLGSLLHAYSSPAIARQLVETGELVRRTGDRLHRTSIWQTKVQLPRGLMRGEAGYAATVQVRLMHAARRAANATGESAREARCVAVNQVEMARTWLDFTYMPIRALAALGFEFTDAELRDLYSYWHYVAHLLGIDPVLYRSVTDHAAAGALFDLIDRIAGSPDDNSRILTQAALDCAVPELAAALRTTPSVARDHAHAIARHIQGDTMADALGIERPMLSKLMPIMVDANRTRHRSLRRNPTAWDRMIAANVSAHRARLTSPDPDVTQRRAMAPGTG
jgi:hypothetical protein